MNLYKFIYRIRHYNILISTNKNSYPFYVNCFFYCSIVSLKILVMYTVDYSFLCYYFFYIAYKTKILKIYKIQREREISRELRRKNAKK